MPISTPLLPTPAISSLVRDALRCSPIHVLDQHIPERISQLLSKLDHANERHRDQMAAFRAKWMRNDL